MSARVTLGQWRVIAAFVFAMALAVAGGGVALRSTESHATSGAWVRHTNDVLATLDVLAAGVATAETTQRGYLLSGDRRYLTRGIGAPADARHALAQARAFTRDNPRQQARLDSVHVLLEAKLAELAETIHSAERGERLGALAIVQSGRGEALTQRLADALRAVRVEERALLAARMEGESAAARRERLQILLAISGGVAAAALGALLLWREAARTRRALDAVAAAEARFRAVFDHAPVGIAVMDGRGTLTSVNDAFGELVGRPAAALLGTAAAALSVAEDGGATGAPMRALRAGEMDEVRLEMRYVRPGGEVRVATLSLASMPNGAGAPGTDAELVGITLDVTEQRRAEAALQERDALVRGALAASLDAIYLCRAARDDAGGITDFEITDCNARGGALVGMPPEQLVDHGLCELFSVARTQGLLDLCRRVAASGEPATAEYEATDPRIAAAWLRLQVVRVADGIAVTARDISGERRAFEALRAQAVIDELTRLLNRRGFLAAAEREWQRARREGRGVVAAYLDLNGFKGINDRFGHAEGDEALRGMADVLREAFRGADVIGRLGGDEFAVLVVPGGSGGGSVDLAVVERQVRDRVRHHLASSNAAARAAGRPYDVAAGMGTASAPPLGHGATADTSLATLMVLADEALYRDKRGGAAVRGAPALAVG